jgi:hypothetical protein
MSLGLVPGAHGLMRLAREGEHRRRRVSEESRPHRTLGSLVSREARQHPLDGLGSVLGLHKDQVTARPRLHRRNTPGSRC